jgi:asparagine synthase (glutamine-hydrolysing)
MGGIAGVIGESGDVEAQAMIRTLAHRGPDGIRGETLMSRGSGAARPMAAVAQARLLTLDLDGGWQPLHAAGCTVIGDGEIYNYRELIAQYGLENVLTTGSDFEPLLHIYAREGEKAFDRLRGMYAFCLIGPDGRVWLVRDPFGVRPLYYRQHGGKLAFASEPRALMTAKVEIDLEPLQDVLALGYVVGRNTPFKSVRQLKPGEVAEVIYGRMAPLRVRSAVPAPLPGSPPPRGEAEALERLDRVLEDAVTAHQRCDAPMGLFLSGGVDSAVIAAMMSRLNDKAVVAYTCGFTAPAGQPPLRDERGQADRVAQALSLDWREVRMGEEDFWRLLPEIAWALDEPTADDAVLPMYRLAEAAKGALKVVLTGEGGDELFAGYGDYRRALRAPLLGGRPAEPRPDAPFLRDKGHGALVRWRQAVEPPAGLDRLQAIQYRDIAVRLPADRLLKLDRCLMAHGVEGRAPFLDPDMARFAFRLPEGMKVHGGQGKWLLRRWLARHCPAADPFARRVSFPTPVAGWIAPRAARLGPRIADHPGVRKLCDAEAVRAVFRDSRHGAHRWPLLFLAVWWGIHVERLAPNEALAVLTD